MAKRNYKIDSGYSSTSPASYSSMSPSQDGPYQDFQSLQLSQVINCNDLDPANVDIHCSFVNHNQQDFYMQPQYKTIPYTSEQKQSQVQLLIIEQPQSKFRYRYASEMHGTHGSLMGFTSSKANKTYPTVELKGFGGEASIKCTLYQIDKSAPHSHRLVVRKNDHDIPDPHELILNPRDGYRAVFQGMGIIHTAKRDIAKELFLKKKICAEFEKGSELNQKEIAKLKNDSESEAKKMKLNQVILRFEAYEIINNQLRPLCEPIYSNPINNMKCALTGELKITRLSTIVSSAAGKDDLFLFVEKVGKNNIKVKFYELDENDDLVWQDYGDFSQADVHHQYAIALRTPPYKNVDIDKYVQVFIQLERPSDGDTSEPMQFNYKPRDCVSSRKRARTSSSNVSSMELPTTISETCSGKSISVEYDKNNFLDSFLNTAALCTKESEYLSLVKCDSDELLKCVDSPLDILSLDTLESDCHGLDLRTQRSSLNNNINITSKHIMFQMSNMIKKAKSDQTSMKKIRSDIHALLVQLNEKNEDLLHRIIRNAEIKEGIYLLKILEKYALFDVLNFKNDDGDNCLHVACTFDRFMFIRPLINLGADPNMQNKKGKTPLHIAVEEEFEKSIEKILDSESYSERSIPLNVDLANDNGYTALHIAVKKRKLNIVEMLIMKGKASTKICCSKNGNNSLHLAVEENSPEIVKFLLQKTMVKVEQKNTSGCTPLSIAQAMGEKGKKIVDILVQKASNSPTKFLEFIKTEKSDSSSDGESDDERSIKSSKTVEDIDIKCEQYSNFDQFDEILIEKLSEILSKNDKWKELAERLSLMCLWKTPKSMFNFIKESKNTSVDDVIEALTAMGEMDAVRCIKTV